MSGVPLNEIRYPQQETRNCSPIVKTLHDLSEQKDSVFTCTLPIVSGQASLLEPTHDPEKTPSYDGRSEALIPGSGNRSRNISEHISPGQYQGSRSGTRSPSLLNTASASGYNSFSDLSVKSSSQGIPQTEHEKNLVLMDKFFDILKQKPSIAKRIVSDSDQDPDDESSPTTKHSSPKLDVADKRESQTELEMTLVSSFDSSTSKCEGICYLVA